MSIHQRFVEAKKAEKKGFAVLVDPDNISQKEMEYIVQLAVEAGVNYFFIGGSLVVNDSLEVCIKTIKENSNIPAVLFPGSSMQLSYKADAILFLSLISGRNPELLIGKHVMSAPYLKATGMDIIGTGYMLIDGGISTTVQYMSNTVPIPANKTDIAICTAIAGEMLGLKTIYMDAGSGALNPISNDIIEGVSCAIDIPLIVGGGIATPELAKQKVEAGADILVVGNAIEKDKNLIKDIARAIQEAN